MISQKVLIVMALILHSNYSNLSLFFNLNKIRFRKLMILFLMGKISHKIIKRKHSEIKTIVII